MWRSSEGGRWPIKAEKSPDERPHPSHKHKNKQNAKGDPLRCYSSNQMDQHVLDIQRNILFLQVVHPDRGVPRHKTARRLPRIPGCGESLPTDFIKPTPRRPRVRLVRQDLLSGEVVVLTLAAESTSPAVNSKVTGRPLGSGARGRSWVWSRSRISIPHMNRIHILPDLPKK